MGKSLVAHLAPVAADQPRVCMHSLSRQTSKLVLHKFSQDVVYEWSGGALMPFFLMRMTERGYCRSVAMCK